MKIDLEKKKTNITISIDKDINENKKKNRK